MNVKKQATQDAVEYARAQLFYGTGAGTRRNLINSKVAWNTIHVEGYAEAFDAALEQQNWADHATKAQRERQRIDRGQFIKRNGKGLITGNKQSMTTGVAAAAAGYYLARELGIDKEIAKYAKKKYTKAKHEFTVYRAKRKLAKQPKN